LALRALASATSESRLEEPSFSRSRRPSLSRCLPCLSLTRSLSRSLSRFDFSVFLLCSISLGPRCRPDGEFDLERERLLLRSGLLRRFSRSRSRSLLSLLLNKILPFNELKINWSKFRSFYYVFFLYLLSESLSFLRFGEPDLDLDLLLADSFSLLGWLGLFGFSSSSALDSLASKSSSSTQTRASSSLFSSRTCRL
jgi:hypothetical protein